MDGAFGGREVCAFHQLVVRDVATAARARRIVNLLNDAGGRFVGEGQQGRVVGNLRGGRIEDFDERVSQHGLVVGRDAQMALAQTDEFRCHL